MSNTDTFVYKTYSMLRNDADAGNDYKKTGRHRLIYGRILFKFAVNTLHITTRSMGYVRFMFTYRAHACESARG
jgi:hypothetical protein